MMATQPVTFETPLIYAQTLPNGGGVYISGLMLQSVFHPLYVGKTNRFQTRNMQKYFDFREIFDTTDMERVYSDIELWNELWHWPGRRVTKNMFYTILRNDYQGNDTLLWQAGKIFFEHRFNIDLFHDDKTINKKNTEFFNSSFAKCIENKAQPQAYEEWEKRLRLALDTYKANFAVSCARLGPQDDFDAVEADVKILLEKQGIPTCASVRLYRKRGGAVLRACLRSKTHRSQRAFNMLQVLA